MKTKRTFLFRAGAVVLLLLIAGAMLIIGRGHTIYFDNKDLEYKGQTYTAPYKVAVLKGGEQVAKLHDKERGMATCIGQKYQMTLEVTQEKGGDEKTVSVTLNLPYNMDGIIVNLPALLAGLPEEAYFSEFVPVPDQTEDKDADGEVITDDFGLPEEF